jgi:hypothetical protein
MNKAWIINIDADSYSRPDISQKARVEFYVTMMVSQRLTSLTSLMAIKMQTITVKTLKILERLGVNIIFEEGWYERLDASFGCVKKEDFWREFLYFWKFPMCGRDALSSFPSQTEHVWRNLEQTWPINSNVDTLRHYPHMEAGNIMRSNAFRMYIAAETRVVVVDPSIEDLVSLLRNCLYEHSEDTDMYIYFKYNMNNEVYFSKHVRTMYSAYVRTYDAFEIMRLLYMGCQFSYGFAPQIFINCKPITRSDFAHYTYTQMSDSFKFYIMYDSNPQSIASEDALYIILSKSQEIKFIDVNVAHWICLSVIVSPTRNMYYMHVFIGTKMQNASSVLTYSGVNANPNMFIRMFLFLSVKARLIPDNAMYTTYVPRHENVMIGSNYVKTGVNKNVYLEIVKKSRSAIMFLYVKEFLLSWYNQMANYSVRTDDKVSILLPGQAGNTVLGELYPIFSLEEMKVFGSYCPAWESNMYGEVSLNRIISVSDFSYVCAYKGRSIISPGFISLFEHPIIYLLSYWYPWRRIINDNPYIRAASRVSYTEQGAVVSTSNSGIDDDGNLVSPSGHLTGMMLSILSYPMDPRIYINNNIPYVVDHDYFKKMKSFESVNLTATGHTLNDYLAVKGYINAYINIASNQKDLNAYLMSFDLDEMIKKAVERTNTRKKRVFIQDEISTERIISRFLSGLEYEVAMTKEMALLYSVEYLCSDDTRTRYQGHLPSVYLIDSDWSFRTPLSRIMQIFIRYANYRMIFFTNRIEFLKYIERWFDKVYKIMPTRDGFLHRAVIKGWPDPQVELLTRAYDSMNKTGMLITDSFIPGSEIEEALTKSSRAKILIYGFPNAGKSTCITKLLGYSGNNFNYYTGCAMTYTEP